MARPRECLGCKALYIYQEGDPLCDRCKETYAQSKKEARARPNKEKSSG